MNNSGVALVGLRTHTHYAKCVVLLLDCFILQQKDPVWLISDTVEEKSCRSSAVLLLLKAERRSHIPS